MILLIDNFDSFTYNVYQLAGGINPDICVVRNNAITIDEIEKLPVSHIIISPGPGFPVSAGISIPVIKHFARKVPLLGICLGHQSIFEAFGGTIIHAPELVHGKRRRVNIRKDSTGKVLCPIFEGLPDTVEVARYHSLCADPTTIPDCLSITADAPDETVMGLMHKEYPVFGVQFHPESILTEHGEIMMRNFLTIH